ncbi:hypothetical protein [Amycolatopsis sp. M39]|uniref:hypothetical protein n=1 Tax=Amycolatopsis TaxID=1813 RepID=UPI0035102F96
MKRNRCRRVGIDPRSIELPDCTTTDELIARIGGLSADPSVHGIARLRIQHPSHPARSTWPRRSGCGRSAARPGSCRPREARAGAADQRERSAGRSWLR